MIKKKLSKGKESGFTLVEIVVVVAIIAVLATVVLPNILKPSKESRQRTAEIQVMQLNTGVARWMVENNTSRPEDIGSDLEKAVKNISNMNGDKNLTLAKIHNLGISYDKGEFSIPPLPTE